MYELNKEEKELIEIWNSNQKENINTKYIASGLKEDESIENFLAILTQSASNLIIQKEKKGTNRLPEILITDNIKYSAIPLSNELKPFLKALSFNNPDNNPGSRVEFSQQLKANLEKIDIPVRLTLFAAQACPHCPIVVEDMIDIANECKNIELQIIDPTMFTEEATANSVMSVPCLILDDDFRWTGSVSMEEVTDVLANRDSSTLKASNLRRILEDGKASWLTEQMIEKNMIFPEFIKLVLHEIWSVRLGAMVVIEELAEVNIKLANQLCPLLWEKFSGAAEDVKGDIFYALGEAGNIEDKNLIEKELITIDSADLKEAAIDAIDTINLRS
ncbi:MAG: thioredoxin family protein [Desulfobacteraceae bacterium]|nr:thioredoxin family protein [Desulfobacteraceae bacterium]